MKWTWRKWVVCTFQVLLGKLSCFWTSDTEQYKDVQRLLHVVPTSILRDPQEQKKHQVRSMSFLLCRFWTRKEPPFFTFRPSPVAGGHRCLAQDASLWHRAWNSHSSHSSRNENCCSHTGRCEVWAVNFAERYPCEGYDASRRRWISWKADPANAEGCDQVALFAKVGFGFWVVVSLKNCMHHEMISHIVLPIRSIGFFCT